MKKSVSLLAQAAFLLVAVAPGRAQEARVATIQPETKARLVLQSNLNSKLNEVDDTVTAVLYEPIYVDGLLVMARGTEFHGRVTEVVPARRGQKSARMSIIFDKVAMPWGEEPVSILITALDDWDADQKYKADAEGQVKGAKRGDKTAENVERGAKIGSAGAGAVILAGAAAGSGPGILGAGAATIAAGMLTGLFVTKGGEVRVAPGAIFRCKFVKPMTLPVIQQPGSAPVPIQQEDPRPPNNSN
jgi:hypothetical protein